ncbi:MAG: DUF4177 domain-containing protein [Pikeienuella sp.]
MSSAEYKTVPAPRRVKKIKGVKGAEATLAKMVEEIISEQASAGWDYVRTDTFPVEEKSGLFSARETVLKGVMVFKRGGQAPAYAPPPQAAPQPAPYSPPPAPTMHAPAPAPTMAADHEDDFVARPVGAARTE